MTAPTAGENWAQWIGRTRTEVGRIDELAVAAFAATLDMKCVPASGEVLPPGWQWIFFNPAVNRSELGTDGHPRRDFARSFLPPIPLPRRMWAGSRIKYIVPLAVGSQAQRESRILRVVSKTGRAGQMCFVTVEHHTRSDGISCVVEEQDIVYREAATAAVRSDATPGKPNLPWRHRRNLQTDSTVLFRYSALTFNGHRIHYDLPYAREVEGYQGLVVHGPLIATFLQLFAIELRPGTPLRSFDFRGVTPLFADEAFELQARDDTDTGDLSLRVVGADHRVVMEATAGWNHA